MAKPYCENCDNTGWYYDDLGSCGDPECCSGAWLNCPNCNSDQHIPDPRG